MGIEVVVFVSHGKSSHLSDCLHAFADNFAKNGHSPEILVVDSTADPAERNQVKEELRAVHRRHRFDVFLSSARENEAYLSRGGPDGLRYATRGDWRIGGNAGALINRGLLATAGCDALFIDVAARMGFVGSPGISPSGKAVPALKTGRHDPYAYEHMTCRVYPGGGGLPVVRSLDVLGLMGDHLGAGGIPFSHGGVGSVSGVTRVAKAGTHGPLDVPYASYYALSGSVDALKLAQSDEVYEVSVASREALRVSDSWSVSPTSDLWSDFFSVSGGGWLMPFLPTGGSSSGSSLSGLLMSLCSPSDLFLNVPWAVCKESDTKTFSPESMQDGASRMSLHDLMFVLVEMLGRGGGLGTVGQGLKSFAGLEGSEFDLLLRNASRTWAKTMCSRVESRLSRYSGRSNSFRSDMQGVIDTYRQMLENESYRIPYELRAGPYSFESDRIIRRQLLQYGDLLSSWDEIRDYVLGLRDRGIRIGVRP